MSPTRRRTAGNGKEDSGILARFGMDRPEEIVYRGLP